MNQMKNIIQTLLDCFFRKKDEERRSPFCNEEVANLSKDTMMKRIADVVRSARDKDKEDKGSEEG